MTIFYQAEWSRRLPDGKHELIPKVVVTILIANVDNAEWWPTQRRISWMIFHAPFKGPEIV